MGGSIAAWLLYLFGSLILGRTRDATAAKTGRKQRVNEGLFKIALLFYTFDLNTKTIIQFYCMVINN